MPISATGVSRPQKLLFLRKFIKHGKRVASVAPSSRSLARAMCRHVNPNAPQTIVELGAGTGAVTIEVAKRMHPESRLIAIEIDPSFADHLRHACPAAEVIVADVKTLPRTLGDAGVATFDLLLNGLPTPSLPRSLNRVILDTFASLAPADAVVSQLTVMPWVYKPMYARVFDDVRFNLVLRNTPPGGVYHCSALRADWRDHIPGVP